jgi:Na+/melibiose symporter-like transporter
MEEEALMKQQGGGGGGGGGDEDREAAKRKEYTDWNSRKKTNFDFSRVMYCVGSVSRVDNVIQNYYLTPFLLDVVGLRPSYVGNVLLIKQLWDAITDPFVGYLSDNISSPLGRRKPFIYFSTPFLWASWILSWTDFETITDQVYIMLYFIAILLVFNLANTCQQVRRKIGRKK